MTDDRGESGVWGLPQCVPGEEPGTSLEEAPHACAKLLRPLRLILAWDNGITVCTCVFVSVCVRTGIHACRPARVLMRGVRDISVCLCMDLRLCGWAHSDMSQATSRPHKSMSLGGGILMWKWEQ